MCAKEKLHFQVLLLARAVEGKPLFERPKGVIDNKEESEGKAKAKASTEVRV
jgi:hypothetical protein